MFVFEFAEPSCFLMGSQAYIQTLRQRNLVTRFLTSFPLSQLESHCFCEDDKWLPWHSVTHSALTLESRNYLISGAGDVCAQVSSHNY